MIGLLLLLAPLWDRPFDVAQASEVVAVVSARCAGCSWASKERTAAMLSLSVDGTYSQHLPLFRGEGPAEYRLALGAFTAGTHRLTVEVDRRATPAAVAGVSVDGVRIEAVPTDSPAYPALRHAPALHVRPDAAGRYTDVPLVLWYETDVTPAGSRLRYSVVFSNEDGGTAPDRLMATWGRLTDIEFVYGVELDREGRVLAAEYQGAGHRLLPYRGPEQHPPLWVVTDNNMVADRGRTIPRYAPAPAAFDLSGASREAVMDAHPWTYAVSIDEVGREGWIREGARPGSRHVVDPRRYVTVEACAETVDAALTFAVAVDGPGGRTWHESDGGRKEFRIVRRPDNFPNGCFRGAVALPPDTPAAAVRGLRFRAFTLPPGEGEPPVPAGRAAARLVRVNRVFQLGPDRAPGPDLLTWQGELTLPVDGPPVEVPAAPPSATH
jgi:hypothetical protein